MSYGNIVQIIGAVVDVEFPRDAMPKVYDALKLDRRRPDARGAAAARRRRRAHHRHGLHRRPEARPRGRATPARRSRCRSARRPWAASWTCSARRIDEPRPGRRPRSAGRSTARRRRYDDQAAATEMLETGIKVIDLHHAVRQGRQGRPVRRRRRRQDRHHDGADQQHRQGSTAASRCSPASASAPARATTSTTR